MAAFANGLATGADGIELDVRLSRDGVVVVHHDETVDRTTAGHGAVASMTALELARLDVPALADVLSGFRETRVIVEMKTNTSELASAVVGVVLQAGAAERVCLGSFGQRVLNAARSLEPAIATSAAREEVRWALYRSWVRRPSYGAAYAGFQVPERAGTTQVVSRRFVDVAHRAGLGVHVWTINDERDARRLLSWGIDAIITDRPDLMVPVVQEVPGVPEVP
jgi:glycerophosphoryl diester phosphodiesterase